MTALKVSIAPAAGVSVPAGLGSLFLDSTYSRALNTETGDGANAQSDSLSNPTNRVNFC